MIKEIVNKERKYNEMNQYVIFLLWLSPVGMCTGMKQLSYTRICQQAITLAVATRQLLRD
ncbi:hypothetical protein GCM10010995_06830 [Cysteiniphilum litorale]|uniref:Uncharacterized protein n=1 Tax=Cysteiniphilum litorale TaxID=2056700 RepID=A0A8J2Z342_9GAMM|nr:hypothetical protein GCM10010995_06830 [Cysteiniphilum litorale]